VKRILSLCFAAVLIVGCLSACGSGGGLPAADPGRLKIVTTIFPEYDWVMNVLGDNPADAEGTLLLDNGVDLHSFQPTAADIMKISTCDLFLSVGGESDKWVDDALREATNGDMVVVDLLDVLGDAVKEEETVEGMQAEDEHGQEEEETEYDEHVWLSLQNAAKLCGYIAGKLGDIDPDYKDAYTANANAYVEKLNALDGKYKEAVNAGNTKTLLFGDRFPFRYLTDDYGLDYYAAFVGCSAESEASFETIMFLANKVDELGLKAIIQIESADGKIARTIKDTTKTKDQTILTLDSMQSTTSADVKNGASYLSIMEKNLEVLKDALK
jgi:zinc transport system substrate-binding protein